jgi:uncharacterized membrane protein YtjA (UPF0391 family)
LPQKRRSSLDDVGTLSAGVQSWEGHMLYWALIFFVVALIAGVLGFSGISAASAGIAQVLFFIFLVIFIISLIMGMMRRR